MIEIFDKASNEFKYSLKKRTNKLILFYSHLGQWYDHFKGKKSMSLTNTGNGYVIKMKDKLIHLDYSQFEQLQLLMKIEGNNNTELYELKKI